jgi:ATP adenylyltransferase/5',5'''-P-1,P-4-tetraphosphate phosphorylase II
MAGKAKSVYLVVADLKTHKTIFTKTFFNVAEYHAYVATEEFLEKYPKDQFYYVKEVY